MQRPTKGEPQPTKSWTSKCLFDSSWIAAEEDLRRAQSHDQMLVTDADIRAIAAKAKKQSKKDYYSVLG